MISILASINLLTKTHSMSSIPSLCWTGSIWSRWVETFWTPNTALHANAASHIFISERFLPEESRMQLVFRFGTSYCFSVPKGKLLALMLVVRRLDVTFLLTVLSMYLLLLIWFHCLMFVKARTFDALECIRPWPKAWTECVLPTIIPLLDWSSTSFMTVRSRSWIWKMTWTRSWPRSGSLMPVWMLVVVIMSVLLVWKSGWRFVRFIWSRTNTCLVF